jgi:ABC-2 type transport system ATP-binding protein
MFSYICYKKADRMKDQTPIISVRDLTKKFGDFTAVDHVTFEVLPGEVVGYLGPNGSGKTTTIRMLCGLLHPTEGSIHILGMDVVQNPEPVKRNIGYMSQKFALYDDLTVRENLEFYIGVYDVAPELERKRLDEILHMAGLADRPDMLAIDLSGGWRQRLALGCALVHQPSLIFLDEPTSGVDPVARREFWDLIYQLASQGTTIFITTHYMDEAEHCRRVGFMHSGRLLAFDTPSALKAQYLTGEAWALNAHPLLDTVEQLTQLDGIVQARLYGDQAMAILQSGAWTQEALKRKLEDAGVTVDGIEVVEPTLEDVFTLLANR